MKRIVTDADIKKYVPMVESFLRKNAIKNWKEASTAKSKDEISLGNTGMTMRDIRQDMLMEVFIGLTKFDPNYRTKEGRTVQEATFIYTHLFNRLGQKLKRLTKARQGYGRWSVPLEKALGEDKEEM